jgi:PAS domain S-box-containing protein
MSEKIVRKSLADPAAGDICKEFGHLTAEIERLTVLLRAQSGELKIKGMHLPPMVISGIKGIRRWLYEAEQEIKRNTESIDGLRTLAETSDLINSSLDVREVLATVMDKIIQITGAERGFIVLRDSKSGDLSLQIARGVDHETITDSIEFTISRSVVEEVAETQAPILTMNAQDDDRFASKASVIGFGLRAILCVPLTYKGRMTGVVYADNRVQAGVFSKQHLNLLMAFANQAAVAIENARLFQRVRQSLAQITRMKNLTESVFTSIASGVITTDGDHKITNINRAAEEMLGVMRDEVMNRPITRAISVLPIDFKDSLRRAYRLNEHLLLETTTTLPGRVDPSYLNLQLSPLRDSDTGETHGTVIVLDDLTELKEREQQISLLQRYLPISMASQIDAIDKLALGGEEREISVLICDVRGFTSFSERLEPEQLMRIINRYMIAASESIQGQKGIIDKYMGDAVVGLFNTQLNPQEDHAERAVRAALAIQSITAEIHADLAEEDCLFYGIGVHTGPSVVGNVGSIDRKEFTTIGNTYLYAKLLESNALKGEIIVGLETCEQLKGLFPVEEIQPRKKRGWTNRLTRMFRIKREEIEG